MARSPKQILIGYATRCRYLIANKTQASWFWEFESQISMENCSAHQREASSSHPESRLYVDTPVLRFAFRVDRIGGKTVLTGLRYGSSIRVIYDAAEDTKGTHRQMLRAKTCVHGGWGVRDRHHDRF